MNLTIDIKNLIFAVIGGVLTTLIASFLVNSDKVYQSRLVAGHNKVQIAYADSIFRDMAIRSLPKSAFSDCKDSEDKKCIALFEKILDSVFDFKHFNSSKYITIHEVKLENRTDFMVSDVLIEHDFSFDAFVVFKKDSGYFHHLKPNEVFEVGVIRPGKVIDITFFSKSGYLNLNNDINITESGKRVKFEKIHRDDNISLVFSVFAKAYDFLMGNAFYCTLFVVFLVISLLFLFCYVSRTVWL